MKLSSDVESIASDYRFADRVSSGCQSNRTSRAFRCVHARSPLYWSMPTTMPGPIPCSSAYTLTTRSRRGDKLFPRRLGNGKIGCPFIGVYLLLGVVSVGFVDKDGFLAVKHDMRCSMEEAEPHVLIGTVSGGQLDDGLPRRQPPSRATERCLLQRLHQRQCNTCLVA